MSNDSRWSNLVGLETMMSRSQTGGRTSSDQRLNVSMSLAAHTPNDSVSAIE